MLNPIISIPTGAELAELAELAAATFVDTYGQHNTPEDMAAYVSAFFSERTLAEQMAEPHSCFLMLRLADKPAGYARMRRVAPDLPVPSPCWEIERFYIDRLYHGMGLAQQLMAACIAKGRLYGYAGLWLGVWCRNGKAIRFYEKMGFRHVGEKPFVLGNDVQTDHILFLALT